MNKYRNPWCNSTLTKRPEFYQNNFEAIFGYRGVVAFKHSHEKAFDFVLEDCCIAQRAGFDKETAPSIIDGILDGKTPVCDEVANHLKENGFSALSYSDYMKEYAAGRME